LTQKSRKLIFRLFYAVRDYFRPPLK